MTLSAGELVPDFELRDQHGQTVRLSSLRGATAAMIVFYPWAFSGVCGGELQQLQAEQADVFGDDVHLLTISTDPMYSLRAYADREGFTFTMLSDFWPHGAVASAYGVFHDGIGIALRGSFLVDSFGVLRWSVVNGIPDARDIEDYRMAVGALRASAAPG